MLLACNRNTDPSIIGPTPDPTAFSVAIEAEHGERIDTDIISIPEIKITVTEGEYVDYDIEYSINDSQKRVIPRLWIGEPAVIQVDDVQYGEYRMHGVVRRSDGKGNVFEFNEMLYMRAPKLESSSASINGEDGAISLPSPSAISVYKGKSYEILVDYMPKESNYEVQCEIENEGVISLSQEFYDGKGVYHASLNAEQIGASNLVINIINSDRIERQFKQQINVIAMDNKAYRLDYAIEVKTVDYGEHGILELTDFSGVPFGTYNLDVIVDEKMTCNQTDFEITPEILQNGMLVDIGSFPIGQHDCRTVLSRTDGAMAYVKATQFQVIPVPLKGITLHDRRTSRLYIPGEVLPSVKNGGFDLYELTLNPSNATVFKVEYIVNDPSIISIKSLGSSIIRINGLKVGQTSFTVRVYGYGIDSYEFTYPIRVNETVLFTPDISGKSLMVYTDAIDEDILFDKVTVDVNFFYECKFKRWDEAEGKFVECHNRQPMHRLSFSKTNVRPARHDEPAYYGSVANMDNYGHQPEIGHDFDPTTGNLIEIDVPYQCVIQNFEVKVKLNEGLNAIRNLIILNIDQESYQNNINWE